MSRAKRATTTNAARTPLDKKRKLSKNDVHSYTTVAKRTNTKRAPIIVPSKKARITTADRIADEVHATITTVVPSEERKCSLYAFGVNVCGQIGQNPDDVEQRKFPSLCEALRSMNQSIKAIAAGGMHSVVLTDKGQVITFGCNDEGALGRPIDSDNTEEESAKPGTVSLPGKTISISAGSSHSAALLEDGSVYCWGTFRDGNGHYGLLPGDDEASRCHLSPVKLQLDTGILSIASGNDHIALLSDQGQVLTFGSCLEALGRPRRTRLRNSGQDEKTMNLTPLSIPVFKKFKDVWCGSSSTFCLEDNTAGTVWVFGMNSQLQLGIRSAQGENMVLAPTKSPAISKVHFKKIAVGEFHCLGLTAEGKVYSWGKPHEGQLGLGGDTPDGPIGTPTCIEALKDRVVSIGCGHSVSYAITEQSELYSWGFGENWQLGKADNDDSEAPQPVLSKIRGDPARKVRAVSSGGQHTLVMAEFGLGMNTQTPMEPAPMDIS